MGDDVVSRSGTREVKWKWKVGRGACETGLWILPVIGLCGEGTVGWKLGAPLSRSQLQSSGTNTRIGLAHLLHA